MYCSNNLLKYEIGHKLWLLKDTLKYGYANYVGIAKTGGVGAIVTATIPVTAGETLGILVGGNGGSGSTGGGPSDGGKGGFNGGGVMVATLTIQRALVEVEEAHPMCDKTASPFRIALWLLVEVAGMVPKTTLSAASLIPPGDTGGNPMVERESTQKQTC